MLELLRLPVRFAALMLLAVVVEGQALPTGFARGVLVENCSSGATGDFSIEAASQGIYHFRSDIKTWIERRNERIPVSSLRPGELLEVVSDRDPRPAASLHYARMVQVVEKVGPKFRDKLHEYPEANSVRIHALSNLDYSGVVKEVTDDAVLIRTRLDGDKLIHLRHDTQLLQSGDEVAHAVLIPSLRVFVKAGRNRNNELEAFQVIWGSILEPALVPGRE